MYSPSNATCLVTPPHPSPLCLPCAGGVDEFTAAVSDLGALVSVGDGAWIADPTDPFTCLAPAEANAASAAAVAAVAAGGVGLRDHLASLAAALGGLDADAVADAVVHGARHGVLHVMERMSQVTMLAKGAAASLLALHLPGGGGGAERDGHAEAAAAPPSVRRRPSADDDGGFELIHAHELIAETAAAAPPPPPLSAAELEAMADDEGRVDEGALRRRVASGGAGLDPSLRRVVWPLLLGAVPAGGTPAERAAAAAERLLKHRALKAQLLAVGAGLPEPERERLARQLHERQARVDKDVVRTDRDLPFFAGDGNAHVEQLRHVLYAYLVFNRETGYCQGMSDLCAPLLFVLEGGRPHEDGVAVAEEGEGEGGAQEESAGRAEGGAGAGSGAAPEGSDHDRDCSDAAAARGHEEDASDPPAPRSHPLAPEGPPSASSLAESLSFWCFVGLLERCEANFAKSQAGMNAQLGALSRLVALLDPRLHDALRRRDCDHFFFAFRMVLLLFKRELALPDCLRLWDCLLARPAAERFHLYVAAGILIRNRDVVRRYGFDELLKYTNDLTGRLDVSVMLRDAEALMAKAGEEGRSIVAY